MKVTALAAGILAALMIIGCDLFYDAFSLTANLEDVSVRVGLPVGQTAISRTDVVDLDSKIIEDYKSNITGGSVYDIRVRVKGDHPGRTINNGVGTVNGLSAVTFGGAWNDYLVEKSVLIHPNMAVQSAGIAALVNALVADPLLPVTITVSGSITTAAAAGDSVIVTLYTQVNADL